jgi:predicted MFS family arabinose efflux permease
LVDTGAVPGTTSTVSEAHRRRLFVASCLALTATAVSFAIRGDILGDLGTTFNLSNEDLGKAAGAWAYGFTLSIFIGGQLVDVLGMKRIVAVAFLMHVAGVILTIFAGGFWTLFAGTLAVGLGNGLVEAFANPLTATIYADQKTEKLNLLHVWFPGGIVIGGLVAFGMALLGLNWQARMAFILVPTLAYGALFLGQEFPPTERVQQGVSTAGMYRAVLRPLFLVIVFCMILTASTELATNQWIAYILSNTAGMAAGGILVLVWINGLMAVGRWFAGPMVHRLSPIGLLVASAAASALGLVGLSAANSPATAIAAATVFAIGICYFWPTMLGVTSERFPDGGALALAIVGGVGTLSAAIFTWILGSMYDRLGPRMALRYMAVLPVILIVVFTLIWLSDRRKRA